MGPASCSSLIPQFSPHPPCFHSSGFFPFPQTSHFLFCPRPFALAFDMLGTALFRAFCMEDAFLFLISNISFSERPFPNPYLKQPLPISLNSLRASLKECSLNCYLSCYLLLSVPLPEGKPVKLRPCSFSLNASRMDEGGNGVPD